jgi:hypothetical protein
VHEVLQFFLSLHPNAIPKKSQPHCLNKTKSPRAIETLTQTRSVPASIPVPICVGLTLLQIHRASRKGLQRHAPWSFRGFFSGSITCSPVQETSRFDAISYACWEQKAQNMDFPLNLDLHLPLPEHMGEFNSNILAILSDFDQLEVEQALRAAGGSNPPSPR